MQQKNAAGLLQTVGLHVCIDGRFRGGPEEASHRGVGCTIPARHQGFTRASIFREEIEACPLCAGREGRTLSSVHKNPIRRRRGVCTTWYIMPDVTTLQPTEHQEATKATRFPRRQQSVLPRHVNTLSRVRRIMIKTTKIDISIDCRSDQRVKHLAVYTYEVYY